MLGQPKPFASLSSALLARKGHARPAMRPQGHTGFGTAPSVDDLGWNDMGDPAPASAPLPAPAPLEAQPEPAAALPPVLVQREALKAVEEPPVAPEPSPEPAPVAAIAPAAVARIARDAAGRGKAAFTLRLDTDRHLRLRLASAVTHRSAQALVTAALDTFLETLPAVEELASQLGQKPR